MANEMPAEFKRLWDLFAPRKSTYVPFCGTEIGIIEEPFLPPNRALMVSGKEKVVLKLGGDDERVC